MTNPAPFRAHRARFLACCLALQLAVLAAQPAAAQTEPKAPPQPAGAARTITPAEQVVALMLPDEALSATMTKVFDASISDESKFTPERRALFDANPGLKDEIAALIRTRLVAIMTDNLPKLRADLAEVVSSDLTPVEIDDTLTFFASGTGKKMLAQLYAGMAASGSADEEAMRAKAMSTMMASLTPEDYPALMAFGSSSAAPKLKAMGAEFKAKSKAWGEDMIAQYGPELMKQVDAAIAAHQAAKP